MAGPLASNIVIEFDAIGPVPFCGMVLSDLGATVIRIERLGGSPTGAPSEWPNPIHRGRKALSIDLKTEAGVELALDLIGKADVLIEGHRPGVMEHLGLGPDICLARNSRLVYGRMTGFGQEGPLAGAPGHDINYIALAGCLAHIGTAGSPPIFPLNLVGDLGGGGMLLAVGVLAALVEVRKSNVGQVVDAAMVDGAALLMSGFHRPDALGQRGTNLADGASHFYNVYECADGEYISIGSLEPEFYAELRRLLDLRDDRWKSQMEPAAWPEQRELLAEIFAQQTRSQWCDLLEGSSVCFAPVLSMEEAKRHPHNLYRNTFIDVGGQSQPAPAPRFSRTQPATPSPPVGASSDSDEILTLLGLDKRAIETLRAEGAVS